MVAYKFIQTLLHFHITAVVIAKQRLLLLKINMLLLFKIVVHLLYPLLLLRRVLHLIVNSALADTLRNIEVVFGLLGGSRGIDFVGTGRVRMKPFRSPER
jgi:hypothetical protein